MARGTPQTPRAIAEQTLIEVARRRGASLDALPASNMIGFGPLGFAYDPSRAEIVVSVLVVEFTVWNTFPEDRPDIEKTVAALKDPAIGGLFDTAGGTWSLDRERGKLRLQIAHPLSATPDELLASADRLRSVYPEWSLQWTGAVGEIVHKGAPLPTRPVTTSDNPYR